MIAHAEHERILALHPASKELAAYVFQHVLDCAGVTLYDVRARNTSGHLRRGRDRCLATVRCAAIVTLSAVTELSTPEIARLVCGPGSYHTIVVHARKRYIAGKRGAAESLVSHTRFAVDVAEWVRERRRAAQLTMPLRVVGGVA